MAYHRMVTSMTSQIRERLTSRPDMYLPTAGLVVVVGLLVGQVTWDWFATRSASDALNALTEATSQAEISAYDLQLTDGPDDGVAWITGDCGLAEKFTFDLNDSSTELTVSVADGPPRTVTLDLVEDQAGLADLNELICGTGPDQ